MKNNKGLSTIVATLIIILLVLVATGIVWVVVRGVVQGGSEDVEINAKCLDSQVEATQVKPYVYGAAGGNNTLNVTLSRTGGNEIIEGVNLVFTDDLGENSFVQDIPGNIANLGVVTKTAYVPVDEIENATKVTVVVYFKDSKGNNQYCQTTNSLKF